MLAVDVVVAGEGISGLLIAAALAPKFSVLLVEQCDVLPQNKYWLTDEKAAKVNPELAKCIDCQYEFVDFLAYDGLTARVRGSYCLWDTQKLIEHLACKLAQFKVQVLTGHRFYSFSIVRNGLLIRANSKTIHARLLIDCMGFGSPLVRAKNIANIIGYYIMHGCEVATRGDVTPVALDNVLIDQQPTFFELFPTSHETAHAGIILPSRHHRPDRTLKGELYFILSKSHYSSKIVWDPTSSRRSYFGIIPVGRLKQPALDRIIFFGEAGQANPAASATGLARMLRVYRELASAIETCLSRDELRQSDLLHSIPPSMTKMNRVFQEVLFESLLSFTSDDFRRLVRDLHDYPDEMITDLVFADFKFSGYTTLRLAADALLRRESVLGPHIWRSLLRFLDWRRSV